MTAYTPLVCETLCCYSNYCDSGKLVLTACVNGFGKRTPLEEYPVKGRGTRGVINIDANDRNGDVVGMMLIVETDEAVLITEQGILIRTRCAEVRETGRGAAGVKLIRLDEGDKLVAVARVAPEDPDKPADAAASPPADPDKSAKANDAAPTPASGTEAEPETPPDLPKAE